MSFYVELSEAKNILNNRKGLRGEVEEWWNCVGLKFPAQLSGCGILGRNVMPRVEFFKFYELCREAQLTPFVVDYENDKFVSGSCVKMSLVHPMIFEGKSKKGFLVIKKKKLINVDQYNGKSSLVETGTLDFHRERMKIVLPNLLNWDMSQTAKKWKSLRLYYQGYLSLVIAHGVLFEDYHGVGEESGNSLSNFTEEVFEPAFHWLKEKFGVDPIIVSLPWKKTYNLHPSDEVLGRMSRHGSDIDLGPIKSLL